MAQDALRPKDVREMGKGGVNAIPKLAGLLTNSDVEIRLEAVKQISEIGTQYILLLLAEMHDSHCLRLPYQARENLPPEVAAFLPVMQQQGFPAIEVGAARARSKRKPSAVPKTDSPQPMLFQDQ